jgi:uronate dehydrogenase
MAPSRILITGAAGNLGTVLRRHFQPRVDLLKLTDIAPMPPAAANEVVLQADLADADAIMRAAEGVEAIVHLGGNATEAPWERIVSANLIGGVNLWEAARVNGVDRVLFASSNHAIGFWRRTETLDHTTPAKPDSRYGLSKAFGEDMATLYALKHGVRGFSMRIGSCFEKPNGRRMLSTWLSFADFIRLVEVGLTADYLNEIVYGVSRNTRSWWDNSNAYRLGYDPRDDAEVFAAEFDGVHTDDPVEEALQGGGYASREFSFDLNKVP